MENKNFDSKKLLSFSIIFLIVVAYSIYAIGLFLKVPIDSDYSNLVFEASDILSGNTFLADWNLTGITFVTTDLMYFIFGVMFAGTTINAYYVAIMLMYYTLLAGALLLLKTKGKRITVTDLLILLAVGGFPTEYACNILRAHVPVPAFVFLALYFAMKAYYAIGEKSRTKEIIFLTLYTLFLILGCAGDAITLIIGIAPIVIVCGYNLISNNIIHKKLNIELIILGGASAIIGTIIEKIFVNIGATNKNSFLDLKVFGNMDLIESKFRNYIHAILGMYDAYFLGEKLMTINTLWHFLRIIVVLFVFYIMFKSVFDFFKRKDTDMLSVILSIGFLIMSLLMILTDIAADVFNSRYIGYFPLLAGVLIVRYFKFNETLHHRIINRKLKLRIPLLVFCIILIVSSFAPVDFKKPETKQDRLATFLEENGLEYGYAKFWNASHVTLSSNEKVKVRAVIWDQDQHLQKFTWFCKNSWYNPDYSNFVVIESADDLTTPFQITEETVTKSIGKPSRILTFEGYTIYIYNKDITDRIVK